YERTARECGIESALFSDAIDLQFAVDRLRSADARVAYLCKAQAPIWVGYSPAAIATRFIELAAGYQISKTRPGVEIDVDTGDHEGRRAVSRARRRLQFESWRFQYSEDRVRLIRSLVREGAMRGLNMLRARGPAPKAPTHSRVLTRDYVR